MLAKQSRRDYLTFVSPIVSHPPRNSPISCCCLLSDLHRFELTGSCGLTQANTTTQSVRLDVLPLPLIQAGPNVSATVRTVPQLPGGQPRNPDGGRSSPVPAAT